MDKPKILILGGCGFIGRNLVKYLLSNDLVSAIRIADKVPPQVAWLNEETQKYFDRNIVEFKSANLINPDKGWHWKKKRELAYSACHACKKDATTFQRQPLSNFKKSPDSCKQAFSNADSAWDVVVNCAGETKTGQSDAVYQEGILTLSTNCAKEAALNKVPHYIELSSGKMNSYNKVPHKENDPVDPWSFIGIYKYKVEEKLKDIPNLNYTILRLANVYGVGDRTSLTPRIIATAIYKHLGETMKLLWSADLKINTVHVDDVCRAIWFVANRKDTLGQIYNIVDDGNSTQGSVSSVLSDYFGIKVDFLGNTLSGMVDLTTLSDDANDKHLIPWADVCRQDGIQNTPLTPHMDAEALQHKHLHLSGDKLKKLGFELNIPALTKEQIAQVLQDYIKMKVFPCALAPAQY